MNKYRFWGLFSGISVLVLAFGAWKKIVHQQYADIFITAGIFTLAISQAVYQYLKFMALRNNKDSKP